jgi:uncharacterized protein (DUF1501 family)
MAAPRAKNGSKGTDHGTGGAMLYAGGVRCAWQIIGARRLLTVIQGDGRDLLPTRDVVMPTRHG